MEERTIGTFNEYLVNTQEISKRIFIKIIENGKEKSIPIKINKKNVILIKGKDTVTFSAFVHRGQNRFSDSRNKGSKATDNEVVHEMTRMLKISPNQARWLLQY